MHQQGRGDNLVVRYQGSQVNGAALVLSDVGQAGNAGDVHQNVHIAPHAALQLQQQVGAASDEAGATAVLGQQRQDGRNGYRCFIAGEFVGMVVHGTSIKLLGEG